MAVSARPENFFQTTSSIEEIERRKRKAANTFGNPIRLPTKILASEVNYALDPSGDIILIAEAGGTVSTVKLSTGEISRLGTGSQAPLTSLAYHISQAPQPAAAAAAVSAQLDIYAGGWDKTITKFSTPIPTNTTATTITQTSFKAHTDFIKCLLITKTPDNHTILLSGSADSELNIWNITAADNNINNKRLATIKPQARGIECIVLDPYSNPQNPTIFFGTSQREILSITLPPTIDEITSSKMQSSLISSSSSSPRSTVHETSVYKITFDTNPSGEGDMWTASADKTAKRLVRENNWIPDTTLVHPDFVRDVVVHPRHPFVITACRDEEIRVWNSGTGALYHVFAGHYEEVTTLVLAGDINKRDILVSGSIDGTVRQWSLDPKKLADEVKKAKEGGDQLLSLENNAEPVVGKGDLDFGLTAEEEAELQALMDGEEEDTLEKMAMDTQ